MRKQMGLTKIDVVVALACVALVLVHVGIINAGGRERSKKEVCLANLRMLANAWQTYAGDNTGKIPVGDVYYSWAFPASAGGPQLAWLEWPHPFPHIMPPNVYTNHDSIYPEGHLITQAEWEHAIAEGTLWKYVGDYNIYRCPVGDKGAYVTYTMSMSMNTTPSAVSNGDVTITNINQISRPAERFVFLDTGAARQGAFYVKYGPTDSRWYDLPPMRHGQGTNFVFADGHAIYRKWTEKSTLDQAMRGIWGGGPDNPCDCDIRWMTKVTWGSVPFTCTIPSKHCEY